MKYDFISKNSDKKEQLKNNISGINKFLLENNTKQLEQIFNFLTSNTSLLLVQGFQGTGKTSLIEHAIQFLTQESIVLKYTCFETSLLDDLLLSFFNDFKKLTALEKIEAPKIKAENFTQKINSYFQTIKNPILIVIESVEEILEANKNCFNDFINHLLHFDNVKIIITGKNFKNFEFQSEYKKISILALEKGIFEKYLRSENCNQIGPLTNELYKHTKGYYFYVTLSLKIINIKQLSLIDFIDSFSKSFLTFNDFILREALSLVDPISGHLIRFLTIIRHPVSTKLLKTLQLWNEEKVLFFVNNLLLSRDGEYIYIKNYYKDISENSIHPNVAIKLHQNCIKLYELQLPLKPFERDLLISRQTMRNEIEFHSCFIPHETITQKVIQPEIKNIEAITSDRTENKQITEESADKNSNENVISEISFTFDDEETINQIANSINDYISAKDNELITENEDSKLSLTELVNIAKQEENKFNHKRVISLCTKALLKSDDEDYYTFLPTIYFKLATSFQCVSDWINAIKYFEMLEEFYIATSNVEQTNNARYNIANIYFITFKNDMAQNILNKILKEQISNNLRIKVLNLLANLSKDNETTYACYEKALSISDIHTDKQILAELYYKFANICQDKDDYKSALIYYKKCTEIIENNSYISSAYVNIGTLYNDIGKPDIAIRYYNESLRIDKENNNLNGMYNSYLKLADLYSDYNYDKAVEYYKYALEIAEKLNDEFYMISAATSLGDMFFNKNDKRLALKYYKTTLYLCKNLKYEQENIMKITNRINEIKQELGEQNSNENDKNQKRKL